MTGCMAHLSPCVENSNRPTKGKSSTFLQMVYRFLMCLSVIQIFPCGVAHREPPRAASKSLTSCPTQPSEIARELECLEVRTDRPDQTSTDDARAPLAAGLSNSSDLPLAKRRWRSARSGDLGVLGLAGCFGT